MFCHGAHHILISEWVQAGEISLHSRLRLLDSEWNDDDDDDDDDDAILYIAMKCMSVSLEMFTPVSKSRET
jgi:hypothetical protein